MVPDNLTEVSSRIAFKFSKLNLKLSNRPDKVGETPKLDLKDSVKFELKVRGEISKLNLKSTSRKNYPLFTKLIRQQRPLPAEALPAEAPPVKGSRAEDITLSESSVYLTTMGFDKVHKLGITGKGVTVAVIDSGVRADHPDLKGKVIKWVDLSDSHSPEPFDDIGHGTHICGIIAGSGKMSGGRLRGGAPDVKLVVIRVTTPEQIVDAMNWIKTHASEYNIKAVNMSVGVDPKSGWRDDPIARGAQELVDSGITVIAAAGNDYVESTIDTPGIAPGVITVAGADDRGTPEPSDDVMYIASSQGPTPYDKLPKPDVVACATRVLSSRAPGSLLDPYTKRPPTPYSHMIFRTQDKDEWNGKYYTALSGTSQATAWVTALVALLYQVNPNLTPQQVKSIIKSTAHPLIDPDTNSPYPTIRQGSGMIDAYQAVLKAMGIERSERKPFQVI